MIATSIPAFHVLGNSKAKGKGDPYVQGHRDEIASGIFHIDMNVHFDPAVDNCPAGTLSIQANMSDGANDTFIASSIELINSYGKQNPTIYLTGNCNSGAAKTDPAEGCRYWVMVVNNTKSNKRTPEIVGFCIHDQYGNRIAYGSSL